MIRASAARLSVLLALNLTACSAVPVAVEAPPPPAGIGVLSPASFGGSAAVLQVLHAAYGERESTIQCVVQITPDALSVIGTTALGQRLFSLRYDGKELSAERAPFAPAQIDPARIVADLQLAYWPLAALKDALPGRNWSLDAPRPGLRRLRHDGRIVAEVHTADTGPWPQRLWLVNFTHGYSLDIDTRPLQ